MTIEQAKTAIINVLLGEGWECQYIYIWARGTLSNVYIREFAYNE